MGLKDYSKSEISAFYDDFSKRQIQAGINARHRKIASLLENVGIKKSIRILEVGCGIGTLTTLIAKIASEKASIVAVDISGESIKIAKGLLEKHKNIQFVIGDFLDLDFEGTFDFVVLPDVIEHIPVEKHNSLFKKTAEMLTADGIMFIHLPHPHFQIWAKQYLSDKMQLIDQSINSLEICKNIYQHGLYLREMKSYALWWRDHDYQYYVIGKQGWEDYNIETNVDKVSLLSKIKGKINGLFSG